MRLLLKNTTPQGFFQAVSLLVGTTIGAGIFAIPYVTQTSGYLIGLFWLVFLTLVTYLVGHMYGQVIQANHDHHQLPGYSRLYFGQPGYVIGILVLVLGQCGALLAYIIGMGDFLGVILQRADLSLFFSLLCFVISSGIVYLGLRSVSVAEGMVVGLMLALIFLLLILGLPKIDTSNYQTNLQALTWQGFFFPYGVIFQALSGYAVIPEMSRILGQKKTYLNQAIWIGVLIPAITYFLFQAVVVGISGSHTSEEAIGGLVPYFNPLFIKAGALFGILTMGTSFLTMAYALKDMFQADFSLPRRRAFFLAVSPPLVLFLLGARSFVGVINVTGLFMGTLTILMIVACYLRLQSKRSS